MEVLLFCLSVAFCFLLPIPLTIIVLNFVRRKRAGRIDDYRRRSKEYLESLVIHDEAPREMTAFWRGYNGKAKDE